MDPRPARGSPACDCPALPACACRARRPEAEGVLAPPARPGHDAPGMEIAYAWARDLSPESRPVSRGL